MFDLPSFNSFDTEVLDINFDSQEMVAVLVASSAVLSLFGKPYQDDSLREVFIPNDIINLTFGVPLLLASTYQDVLVPGVLAYHAYSSFIYVLALSDYPGLVFLVHLGITYMSCSRLWDVSVRGTSLIETNHTHNDLLPHKYAGSILIFWGGLFTLRALLRMGIFEFFETLSETESAVCIGDILIGCLWVVGGYRLRKSANIALGLFLLVQASALFFGVILILLIRPFIFKSIGLAETMGADILAVSAMGLSVAIPCARFLTAAIKISAPRAKT